MNRKKGIINYGFDYAAPIFLALFGVLLERRPGRAERCTSYQLVTDFL